MIFAHPNLLAAIHKACPELMELTFGCQLLRIARDKWEKVYYVLEEAGQGRPPEHYWISSSPFGHMDFVLSRDLIKNGGEFEILGHEPQLADVLRAIAWHGKNIYAQLSFGVNVRELIIKVRDVAYRPNDGGCIWDLSLGLYGQSTETKDFLESLLVSK